jgi:hypothetical protein
MITKRSTSASDRARRGLGVLGLLAMLLATTVAAAAPSSGLADFVRTYRCPLLEALETIRAHPMTPMDRYIVLSVDERQRYAQCLFVDGDRQIMCEASSGRNGPKPHLRLSKAQRGAIAALGYQMNDGSPNFWLHRAVAGRSDLLEIAELMLKTLHQGYGARLGRVIGMRAPFAPGKVLRPGDSSCVPVG